MGRTQRRTQPSTAGGGLSWWLWLWPLRGGHGRGLRRFAAVIAEVLAPSWWSRRRSFLHRHKNNAKHRFTSDFRLFVTGTCSGFAPLRGTCAARRVFGEILEKKGGNKPKTPTFTVRGRWSCGGLRRAALEVATAVFCGHGRWFILEVFLGFSIWRLNRPNP